MGIKIGFFCLSSHYYYTSSYISINSQKNNRPVWDTNSLLIVFLGVAGGLQIEPNNRDVSNASKDGVLYIVLYK
jgi:hypothetical protein